MMMYDVTEDQEAKLDALLRKAGVNAEFVSRLKQLIDEIAADAWDRAADAYGDLD